MVEIAAPPAILKFYSLADLLQQYEDLFVGKNIRCPRGLQVVFERHHFFHLVWLRKGHQTKFLMSEERDAILSTAKGFGEYSIDQRRAETLPWILDTITNPHEIWEYEHKKTADEVYIKEYLRSGSPYKVVLVTREEDYLVPVTSMTVRRTGVKEHRRGGLLWKAE